MLQECQLLKLTGLWQFGKLQLIEMSTPNVEKILVGLKATIID